MDDLLRIGLGIVLLLVTLSVGVSYLSPWLKLAKRSGIPKVGKKVAGAILRIVFLGFRRILGRLPLRIRPLRRRAGIGRIGRIG